jgi:hypothetical protein
MMTPQHRKLASLCGVFARVAHSLAAKRIASQSSSDDEITFVRQLRAAAPIPRGCREFSSGVAPGPPVITALFWGEHAIGRAGFIPLRLVATPPDRFPGEILFRFPSSPLGCEGRAFAAIAPQRTPKTNPGTATLRQAAGQGARRNSADQPRRTAGTSALFPVSPKHRSASKDYNPPRRGRFTQSNSSRSADRRKNVRL